MIIDFVNPFINFFIENLLIIQIISFLISSILLGCIIYFLFNTEVVSGPVSHFIDVFNGIDTSRRGSIKAWKQIQKKLQTKQENQLKLAVVEANNILNGALRAAGYQGKNLGERLSKIVPVEFCNIEEVKRAHEIKKRIDSEPDFSLTHGEAKMLVDIYKKALQDLNLIK